MPIFESNTCRRSQNLETVILNNLKSGDFENLSKDVNEFVTPVLNGKIDDLKKYGIFSVQFLHSSLKSTGAISDRLLEAVQLCYKCYKQTRNHIQLNEPLAVSKVLYHILTKLPLQGYHQWRISLCNILYDELADVADGNQDILSTIANSTYSHVWNLTVKQEQELAINEWQILQLRYIALKILLLKNGTVSMVMEKLVLVLTRFIQKLKKVDESLYPVTDLVTTCLTFLHGHKLSEGEELSPLCLLHFLFRYGVQNDAIKAIELGLVNVDHWMEKFQNDTVVLNIYKVFNFVGQQLLLWSSPSTERNLPKSKTIRQPGKVHETLQSMVEIIPQDKMHIVVEVLLVHIRYVDKIDLQTDKLLSVVQSYAGINNVMLTWKPTHEKFGRMVFDLVQTEMKILFEYTKNLSGDQFCDVIPLCEEITQTYNSLLSDTLMKAKDQERHYCGYITSKLAHMCFEREKFRSAILFYKVACEQLSNFVNSEKSLRQTRLEEVSLSKVYVRLAETFLKCGETSLALETITSCILVDPGDLKPAVAFWVKAKKDLLKTRKEDFIKKTLGQCVYDRDDTVDKCALLQSEHEMFKSSRKRFFEAEQEILEQLIEVANEPFVKGKAMLEMAQVLWQNGMRDSSTILKYLTDAENQLVGSTEAAEILGQVLLWQYIVNNEDFCQQILSSTDIQISVPQEEPGEEKDTPFTDKSIYMTVTMEMEAIKQLDKSVALWDTLDDVRDVSLWLQSVLICSRIYQLLNKPGKQLQVIQIYQKLSRKHVTMVSTEVTSHMIESLLSVDMVTEAEKLVGRGTDWDKETWKEDTVNYQITRSHFYLYNKQYEEGMSILKDVLTLISQKQNSTWSMFVLEGRAKRLMSQYLTFPGHVTNDYCMDYACEAVRFHTGVVHFLMGKEYLSDKNDIKKGKSIDKWTALIEILESLYNLGWLYSHIGEAREAKCYLKEGWKIARYYGLPVWNVKFSSELVRLHCKSDKGDETVQSLKEITQVLPTSGSLRQTSSTDQPSFVPVPECLTHIMEGKYCDYCRENLVFVLTFVTVVAETHVILNDKTTAISFLEKSEEIVGHLIKGKKGNNSKHLQSLYDNIVLNLAELYVTSDVQKCQMFLNKVGDSNDTKFGIGMLAVRHGLCLSLLGPTWQNLQKSSSVLDREVETDDFMDCLPVVNLTKKFESLSVKSNKQLEQDNDQSKEKTNGRLKGIDTFDSKDFDVNENQDPNQIVEKVKSVKKNVRESKIKQQNVNITEDAIDKVNKQNKVISKKGSLSKGNNSIDSTIQKSKSKMKSMEPGENDALATPDEPYPKLAMKTPRSVCSRKAILDMMLDSDEDDIIPVKTQKKSKTNCKKNQTNTDIYQFSDEDKSAETKTGQSKIPRPVTQKKLFDADNKKVTKQKTLRTKRGRGGSINTDNTEIEAARHELVMDGNTDISIEMEIPCHVIPQENKKSSKSKKSSNDKNDEELNQINQECQFDEKNGNKKQGRKTTQCSKKSLCTTSQRVQRSRVSGTEKTRSDSDSEGEKLFTLEESLSVKDEESVIDVDQSEDISFSLRSRVLTDDCEILPVQEVTEIDVSLNESIEILRGDNKTDKGTKKGRIQKKKDINNKGQTEEETEEKEEGATGETTEVLRSSKLLKRSQIKTEKKVLLEPHLNTTSQINPTDSELIHTLEKAYCQIKHLPSPPVYTSICQMLALQYMELSPLKAAFYLAESIAVTFRHQSLINAARKIRKSTKCSDGPLEVTTDVGSLQNHRELLHFNKTEEDFKEMMNSIPEDWSICQLSVISQCTPAMMLLSRLDQSGQPIVIQLPGFNSDQGREILSEFSSIISESRESVKVTDKNEWWKWRGKLDTRMQLMLENMEKYWLGRWKFLFLGHPVDIEMKELTKATDSVYNKLIGQTNKPINKAIIKILLQNGVLLSDHQLHQVLTDLSDIDNVSEIVVLIKQFWSKNVPSDTRRHHVILLLDKSLQHLPWENIPILRRHSLSRLPSLYHMVTFLSQKGSSGSVSVINKHSVYYVLNPDNNLPSTQETFQNWFEKNKGWQGIVGKPPSAEQNKKALTDYDLLVYCGHGTGSKYLSGDDLQQIQCRAAVFLMGCSSGQLQTKGQLEASGMMLNYFLANCPCIISNLWDVTDKDIDRFLEHLLHACMSDSPCDVVSEIPAARDVCRLPFLIGAAPVVYGFPIITK